MELAIKLMGTCFVLLKKNYFKKKINKWWAGQPNPHPPLALKERLHDSYDYCHSSKYYLYGNTLPLLQQRHCRGSFAIYG